VTVAFGAPMMLEGSDYTAETAKLENAVRSMSRGVL
jgi:hypothetical protein